MKKMTPEEIKNLQLEILLQFHDFCEKNGLQYFLYAGTLLGAVRHKGFIPWDDDIDVIMPRPDYERFFELSKKTDIGKYLEVSHYLTRKDSNSPFIKLTDRRTDGHEMHLDKKIMCGVWIDVFPLDGVPENDVLCKEYIDQMQKKIRLLHLSSRPLIFCANPLRFIKRLFIYAAYHRYNYNNLARELDETARTSYPYSESVNAGVVCFCGGHNNIVPRSVFEDSVLLPFEGYMFKAPRDYDFYLTSLFGDYMTPPPPEKQISAHEYTAWWKDGFESYGQEVSQ